MKRITTEQEFEEWEKQRQKDWEMIEKAKQDFLQAICETLGIDKAVDYLENKLSKTTKKEPN